MIFSKNKQKLSQIMSVLFMSSVFVVNAYAEENWNKNDLDAFINGATIMAAGGGGSPTIAKQLLVKYFSVSDVIKLVNIEDIPDGIEQTAASLGAIGSPAELFKLPDPLGLPYNAYIAMEQVFSRLQKPIEYLMPIEVGAVNGLYPFLLANKLNEERSIQVSVLNVDGGGRSVPTLPLLIYSYFPNIYNQQAIVTSPTASIIPPFLYPSEWALLTAPSGNQLNIENTILSMLSGKNSPYKGAAGYGSFHAKASEVKEKPPVVGQIQVAHDIGVIYKEEPVGLPIATKLTQSGRPSKVIFSGTVTNITLDTEALDYGVVTIQGSGDFEGDIFTIQYENENICAYKDSFSNVTPFILGPDSITYIPRNGVMFDNSDLYNKFKKGEMPVVDIVGISASSDITKILGIMSAWDNVRKTIPNKKCDFPYSTPWLKNSTEAE